MKGSAFIVSSQVADVGTLFLASLVMPIALLEGNPLVAWWLTIGGLGLVAAIKLGMGTLAGYAYLRVRPGRMVRRLVLAASALTFVGAASNVVAIVTVIELTGATR